MNWLELLLVAVFFGAPLLGRLLRRNEPQEPRLPPVEAETEGAGWLPAPAPARTPPAPAEQGGWSSGWGGWPGMETEAEEEEEEEETALQRYDRGTGPLRTAEPVSLEPVAVRDVAPRPVPVVVSLEETRVDRKAEHQRFHRKLSAPARARPRADRLADHLDTRRELRRAVLLAEVMGPPRSLRELGQDR